MSIDNQAGIFDRFDKKITRPHDKIILVFFIWILSANHFDNLWGMASAANQIKHYSSSRDLLDGLWVPIAGRLFCCEPFVRQVWKKACRQIFEMDFTNL